MELYSGILIGCELLTYITAKVLMYPLYYSPDPCHDSSPCFPYKFLQDESLSSRVATLDVSSRFRCGVSPTMKVEIKDVLLLALG